MSKKDVSHSKFLSLVLRHQPETIGVTLDPQGWIEVDVLLEAMAKYGRKLEFTELERLVRESDKQRFALHPKYISRTLDLHPTSHLRRSVH
jgi:putative RNA 2'-phosphotransferase